MTHRYHSKRKKPALLVLYSNCHTASKREIYLREVSKYFNVESRGTCRVGSNSTVYDGSPWNDFEEAVVRKQGLARRYMFTAAMENTVCKDYVSEKAYQSLQVGSVPLFLGAPNAKRDYFPSNSTIYVNDFDNAKTLSNYLTHLVQDRNAYEKYLEWKMKPPEAQVAEVWNHSIEKIAQKVLSLLLCTARETDLNVVLPI